MQGMLVRMLDVRSAVKSIKQSIAKNLMENYYKISRAYWKKISSSAYDVEYRGMSSGKRVTYANVRVVRELKSGDLSYSYVTINNDWW